MSDGPRSAPDAQTEALAEAIGDLVRRIDLQPGPLGWSYDPLAPLSDHDRWLLSLVELDP